MGVLKAAACPRVCHMSALVMAMDAFTVPFMGLVQEWRGDYTGRMAG
jgi:hypothetical protein